MTGPIIPAGEWPDEFKGDNAKLIGCINALLSMDASGALVPHGVGGHARSLLAASANRIAMLTPQPAIDLEQFREAVSYASSAAAVNTHAELEVKFRSLLALIDGQANVRSSSEHISASSEHISASSEHCSQVAEGGT